MKRFGCLIPLAALAGLLGLLAGASAQHPGAPDIRALGAVQPVPKEMPAKKGRGHKTPAKAVLDKRHADAFKRHDHRVSKLPTATPAQFDCRSMGWVGPVQDQGQCGSCWDVSATGVVTNAFIKAGLAKADGSFVLSPQYVLDCGQNGGCDGDDAPTVLDMAKGKGLPTSADYGPYTAGPGRCRFTNQKLYTIADWGFATSGQQYGFATTQEIKNAIVQYGAISSAVAANSDWDNVTPTSPVLRFRSLGENDIDHDISLVGWDDAKVVPGATTKGAFLLLNQWGTSWGDAGYCWVGYGSHAIGYEAAWVTVGTLPPLPPPDPPGPPVPPTPPVPGGGFTGALVTTQNYVNGVPVGPPVLSIGGGTGAGLEAELKTAGVSPAIIADVLKLLADLKAKAGRAVILADILKIVSDFTLAEPEPKADSRFEAVPRGERFARREEPCWILCV